jgi:dihydrofolate reductase
MGRIIATEHISLDGVVEAPGPGDIGDHPHKGWVFDFEPGETGERYKLDEALAAEVLLLGRVTYETMPGFDGQFADKLNAMPKYVLSTTLGPCHDR